MIKSDQGYLVVVEEEYEKLVQGMRWVRNFNFVIRREDCNIPDEPYLYMIPEKIAYFTRLLEYKLPEKVLQDCNNGLASIFVNFGTEPSAYDNDFEKLHNWMDKTGLNDFTVIYSALDLDAPEKYQQFCDKNNTHKRAHVYADTVSIKGKYTMNWGTYLPLPRRRFGYFTRNPENPYGPLTAYQIHRDPLLREQTIMTCDIRSPWDAADAVKVDKNQLAHVCKKMGLPYDDRELENFISALPINSKVVPDNSMCLYTPYLYDACDFVIIRETNQKITSPGFFSEKIYKAFLGRKPFMLVGVGKMLDKLHEQGYKTFPDFVDESYSCDDPDYMMQTIMSEMRRIAKMDDLEFRKMVFDMHDIIEHNYEVFRKSMETVTFYL
jgi:hypothetical protein